MEADGIGLRELTKEIVKEVISSVIELRKEGYLVDPPKAIDIEVEGIRFTIPCNKIHVK